MTWTALLALCAISYALKASGPVLAGGRRLGPQLRQTLDLVAVPLLAALILLSWRARQRVPLAAWIAGSVILVSLVPTPVYPQYQCVAVPFLRTKKPTGRARGSRHLARRPR